MKKTAFIFTIIAVLLSGCTTNRKASVIQDDPIVMKNMLIIDGVIYHFQPIPLDPPLPPRRPIGY
jgi:uncharacterized protein YcfL